MPTPEARLQDTEWGKEAGRGLEEQRDAPSKEQIWKGAAESQSEFLLCCFLLCGLGQVT